jgi:dehydrogenase/reductase SDR family protein 12
MMLIRGLAFYARFLLSATQIGFEWRALPPLPKEDWSGKTWLVTGASGGLGRAISERAAANGAHVIAAARSAEKLAQLSGVSGVAVEVCDFSLMSDTTALVQRLIDSNRKIDVLVNNVGSMAPSFATTNEGKEVSVATNLLSHFLLTESLLKARVLNESATIINMSSGGAYVVPLSLKGLFGSSAEDFDGTMAYAFQKRAQIALNDYWRKRHSARFYALHPGWVDTAGVQRSLPLFRSALRAILRDANSGSDTVMWLAATKPAQETDGMWFDRELRPAHIFDTADGDSVEALVSALEKELAGQFSTPQKPQFKDEL